MKFDALEYGEVITRDLKVADATAITLCRDNKLPILVFELLAEGNIARAVKGEKIGTLGERPGHPGLTGRPNGGWTMSCRSDTVQEEDATQPAAGPRTQPGLLKTRRSKW